MPDAKGSSNPVVRRIVKSKLSKERFHESLGMSYSTAESSFRSYITLFVSDSRLCGTLSIRIGEANEPRC